MLQHQAEHSLKYKQSMTVQKLCNSNNIGLVKFDKSNCMIVATKLSVTLSL
jgi:hypothetical protein